MDVGRELAERFRRTGGIAAGCLSGTSADGIDVVLARFPAPERRGAGLACGTPESLVFETRAFPAELGARLRAVLDGAPLDVARTAILHRDLGCAFGRAVRDVARDAGLVPELVGSHGQTVVHHDGVGEHGRFTLQLGDGDFVAAEARAAVVSDFRQADLAAGGEGAPLSALADGVLFPSLARPAAILNLGGMANLTLLGGDGALAAFDTGPAGSLLDGLARRLCDRPFDEGGAVAASGRPDPLRVAQLLRHPFFHRAPPRSTGRDTFGEAWVDAFVEGGGRASAADLVATGVELVAASVALALEHHVPERPRDLVVAGGGVHNRTLVHALERLTGLAVHPSDAFGVDPDAREALVFAVLAVRAVLGIPSTHPGATGARAGRVLGKLSLAPPREELACDRGLPGQATDPDAVIPP